MSKYFHQIAKFRWAETIQKEIEETTALELPMLQQNLPSLKKKKKTLKQK